MVDRISELPSEVLVDILSKLTFNEVGRSSILSKRWRNLWKMTRNLNFEYGVDAVFYRGEYDVVKRRLDLMRSKVRTWVNDVLRLHECPSIQEFIVKCDFDCDSDTSASQDIDEWIKFMIRKRVKTVDLDFSGLRSSGTHTISKECRDYIMSESNMTNLMNLRSLRLNYVNLDGPLVELLLSKCPYLEVLSVTFSCTLLDLNIVGPPSLKYLECHSCTIVESVKIEAPKLGKFVYFGRVVKFYIGSNPCLTELDLGGAYEEDVVYALDPFGHILRRHLDTLTLRLELDVFFPRRLPNIGELSNLKHLTLDFKLKYCTELYPFTKLIASAPVLAKLTLLFAQYWDPTVTRDEKIMVVQPHGSLKEIEIVGFRGIVAEIEMVKYVVTNAVNLEKLVINPVSRRRDWTTMKELQNRLAEIDKHVQDMKKVLPLSAKFIVVDRLVC